MAFESQAVLVIINNVAIYEHCHCSDLWPVKVKRESQVSAFNSDLWPLKVKQVSAFNSDSDLWPLKVKQVLAQCSAN
jgi:hypothetical protein